MNVMPSQKSDVLRAQNRFFLQGGVCLLALGVIHCLPKSVPAAVRLIYTVGYFAAILGLLYQFVWPLRDYLSTLYAWRFEGAPDPIERAYKSLLFSLQQLIAFPCYMLMVFFASVALVTLALWFEDLKVLSPLYNLCWWVSLLAFFLYPFAGGFLFHEVIQKHRTLLHETQLSKSFSPRALADLKLSADDGEPCGVACRGHLQFDAGGFSWRWNDFVQNCMVFGQIGSGKTSCVLNSIIDGLLGSAAKHGQEAAGLILDPKGTFHKDLQTLCLRYHRGGDVLVIDPDQPNSVHWNPFDSPDDEYELASRVAAVFRSMGMKDSNSSFWVTKATMFIQYALELLRLTNEPGVPPSFAQIHELVGGFDAISERADRLDPSDPRGHRCLDFFSREWSNMASETRTSVEAHLTGMLYPFLREPYATVFAGTSSMHISDMIDQGKILYLHMPSSDRETMARTIGIFIKLEYYREVLRRPRKDRPSFFFCDEFQKFFTAGSRDEQEQERSDADTFRLSRESNHANVVATQNIGALGDLTTAKALLSNCLTTIFLRNPDEETNQFASQLFGRELVGMVGASQSPGGHGRLRPVAGQQVSTHDQPYERCPPQKFRELAICSRDQRIPHCESIVFLSGRGEYPVPVRKLKWKRHPLSV